MPAGVLRELIHLCVPNVSRDASGQETRSESQPWKRLHRKIPAGFVEVSGGEGVRGQKVEAATTAIFTIRYIRDFDKKWGVELVCPAVDGKEASRFFEVVTALDRKGDAKWLEVQATEVK